MVIIDVVCPGCKTKIEVHLPFTKPTCTVTVTCPKCDFPAYSVRKGDYIGSTITDRVNEAMKEKQATKVPAPSIHIYGIRVVDKMNNLTSQFMSARSYDTTDHEGFTTLDGREVNISKFESLSITRIKVTQHEYDQLLEVEKKRTEAVKQALLKG